MKTTLPRREPSQIRFQGSEPIKMTREKAVATFRAYRFLGEPCEIRHPGEKEWRSCSTIARPWGLTDEQAVIAIDTLCHDMSIRIESVLPAGTTVNLVDQDGFDCKGRLAGLLEIGDGWTMGPTIEQQNGYRGAIRWHVFNPEGDPILENATETDAAIAIATRIAIEAARRNYKPRGA